MPRVAQLEQPREPLCLVERSPGAPGPREVRVRVEACALGQLDWNLLTLDAPPRLPLVPGHEAVGVVEAAGEAAALAPGARVLVTPLAGSCGRCAECGAGEARRCAQARWRGMHADGALGTHLVAHESGLRALPGDGAGRLPPETLALAGGSLWTAVGGARALRLATPARVAVFGVGGVGHLACQVLRERGHEVLAVDVDPERLQLALALGARPLEGVVDAALVCTPSVQAVQQAVRAVRPGARVVLVGTGPASRLDVAVSDVVWRQLELAGGLLGGEADLAEGLALLASGRVTPHVEVAPLAEAVDRLWRLRDLGFPGRLVFVP